MDSFVSMCVWTWTNPVYNNISSRNIWKYLLNVSTGNLLGLQWNWGVITWYDHNGKQLCMLSVQLWSSPEVYWHLVWYELLLQYLFMIMYSTLHILNNLLLRSICQDYIFKFLFLCCLDLLSWFHLRTKIRDKWFSRQNCHFIVIARKYCSTFGLLLQ